MLSSALEEFNNSLFIYLSEEKKCHRGLLLKKHSDNFKTHGDFSFVNNVNSWQEFLKEHFSKNHDNNYLKCIMKSKDDIIKESKNWSLQVIKTQEEKDRVYLYFDRKQAFSIAFKEIAYNVSKLSLDLANSEQSVVLDLLNDNSCCITGLRLKCLGKAIGNLSKISCLSKEDMPVVFVTAKSSSNGPDGAKKILCGTVLNSKTGSKESTLTAEDFIRKRQEEMTLIAQHKYGVRVSTDSKWKAFISSLGDSAVVFELLETNPATPVKINFDCCSAGSSKGASFVLYNCARLETLLRTYDSKVEENIYPALPPIEQIDFSLLTYEEEWSLVYNFVLGLPSVLKNCVDVTNYNFRPHLLCNFLSSLVRLFSQYYRKVRILTEPRKHLLPVIFARMHMLHALNQSLRICLQILDIKSVSQM